MSSSRSLYSYVERNPVYFLTIILYREVKPVEGRGGDVRGAECDQGDAGHGGGLHGL